MYRFPLICIVLINLLFVTGRLNEKNRVPIEYIENIMEDSYHNTAQSDLYKDEILRRKEERDREEDEEENEYEDDPAEDDSIEEEISRPHQIRPMGCRVN